MSEAELTKFITKVNQLKLLVESLETEPGRREQLLKCRTHSEVVELARSWGYAISRRWGEE